MTVYILSVFLSAFLLFQIQPMIGHYILPWFGGTTSVWSAVMLFFQVLLTAGYAYAYGLIGRVSAARQWRIHLALLTTSLVLMVMLGFWWPSPITPGLAWRPTDVRWPVLQIFAILGISVGLPYLTLASNSPLNQAWFARRFAGRSPYWLYALSNAGSLLGLLSYPFAIEPHWTLRQQGWIWSATYLLFAVVTAYGAWRSKPSAETEGSLPSIASQAGNGEVLPIGRQALWLTLSALANVMLLAVTSQITQEIAPIPLLWVLPLAIYLLSFVFAFSGEGWYRRPWFTLILAVASVGIMWTMVAENLPLPFQVAIYLLFLFAACMVANGELYRLRPAPHHLTRFYLLISIGGALGGLLVNLVAPLIFKGYWELHLGWAMLWVLLAVLTFLYPTALGKRWRFAHDLLVGSMAVATTLFAGYVIVHPAHKDLWKGRNFYGTIRVQEDKTLGLRRIVHGTTIHGLQITDLARRDEPTGYYWPGSGIGLLLTNHPRYGQGMKVGILGLGIGGLAAYGKPGDIYRFYEINPMMIDLAGGHGGYFSFLQDSKADKVEIVLGDARISLEKELQEGRSQAYDVFVMDAFNSDSIPVHLLTREAFALYLQHLAPEGVLVVHISNRYLDLRPVIWQAAHHFGLEMIVISSQPPAEHPEWLPSIWTLLARDPASLRMPAIAGHASQETFNTQIRLWTDDYSNLFQVLK